MNTIQDRPPLGQSTNPPNERDRATLEAIYAAERAAGATARIERDFVRVREAANEGPIHDAAVTCLGSFGGWHAACTCGWKPRPPNFVGAYGAHLAVVAHLDEFDPYRAKEYRRQHL